MARRERGSSPVHADLRGTPVGCRTRAENLTPSLAAARPTRATGAPKPAFVHTKPAIRVLKDTAKWYSSCPQSRRRTKRVAPNRFSSSPYRYKHIEANAERKPRLSRESQVARCLSGHPRFPRAPRPPARLRRRFAVGGMTTGLRHRVGTVPIRLARWRISVTVAPQKKLCRGLRHSPRCAKGETERYLSFTFRLPSLLDWRPFGAHTTDLMRAHYQQPTKPERKLEWAEQLCVPLLQRSPSRG